MKEREKRWSPLEEGGHRPHVRRLNLPDDPAQYYKFVSKIPIDSNTRVEEAKDPEGKLREMKEREEMKERKRVK
jgi:hypothetical protein